MACNDNGPYWLYWMTLEGKYWRQQQDPQGPVEEIDSTIFFEAVMNGAESE